jgi:hypothetical protein
MKKFLLLFLILFAIRAKSQTNVYHPFPDSAAVWNFNLVRMCWPNGWEMDYYSVQISDDTVINSQVYHKLSIPFIQHNFTDLCSEVVGYQGAVRQDTSIKKVFIVLSTDTIEQLLYDFNMQVGDTVRGILNNNLLDDEIVQSIDSILVGNNYRKRWNINPYYNISLIEGIGSTYGLIKSSPGNIVDQPDYSLTCFSQNGFTLYPDTFTNCEIINGVKNISSSLFETSIAPNPFHNSASLKINSVTEMVTMRIYSPIGLLVREDKVLNGEKYILKRGELRNGIYFLQLMNTEGQTTNEKFILE